MTMDFRLMDLVCYQIGSSDYLIDLTLYPTLEGLPLSDEHEVRVSHVYPDSSPYQLVNYVIRVVATGTVGPFPHISPFMYKFPAKPDHFLRWVRFNRITSNQGHRH